MSPFLSEKSKKMDKMNLLGGINIYVKNPYVLCYKMR